MNTFMPKNEDIKRKWYLIDAEGKTLGKIAVIAATYLRGKQKVVYTPHADMGDYVVIINAEKVKVTGKKEKQKMYFRFSGYPSGLKEENLQSLRNRCPEKILEFAIKGMLPHNSLGRKMYGKLKVFKGKKHSYISQIPEVLQV